MRAPGGGAGGEVGGARAGDGSTGRRARTGGWLRECGWDAGRCRPLIGVVCVWLCACSLSSLCVGFGRSVRARCVLSGVEI